eukprot:TRINITY_DN30693_c0_g1_i3.p2 TRINITY_DN30693_c0_g1~~TRINITY_DN30693_c0_g1_i3.p2  ORF type:complete len:135 (+),score=11.48 TRINITY_DN30693_c0_g1_i3:167-571(+)
MSCMCSGGLVLGKGFMSWRCMDGKFLAESLAQVLLFAHIEKLQEFCVVFGVSVGFGVLWCLHSSSCSWPVGRARPVFGGRPGRLVAGRRLPEACWGLTALHGDDEGVRRRHRCVHERLPMPVLQASFSFAMWAI